MGLSAAQLVTFKADLDANIAPVIVQALIDGTNIVIADWYNGDGSPDYWVFRKDLVSPEEIGAAIELDDLANMTTGDVNKLSAFFLMRPGGFNGNAAADRAGFADVLSAAAADESQQAVAALWKRIANRVERLFVLSTGTGDSGDPDTLGYEGTIGRLDVAAALKL